MAFPSHSAHLPDPTPSPLPTPPASTTAIHLCFPSPTSVADVLPVPTLHSSNSNNNTSHSPIHTKHLHQVPNPSPQSTTSAPTTTPSPDVTPSDPYLPSTTPAHPALQPPPPPPSSSLIPSSLHNRPDLSNTAPARPLPTVTKAQFTSLLTEFTSLEPPNSQVDSIQLASRIRHLLDHLDALTEQLSLRVTKTLFDALACRNCLSMLLFLLSDTSAKSSPVMTDIRKAYRYPYLVANILANGTMGFRDVFIASKHDVAHLLSFLDGDVVLSTSRTENSASEQQDNPGNTHSQVYARDNPIIVGNVVQILVSYMETSPEALLQEIRARPTFVPAIVNLLHIGSVTNLLNCFIPDRCVDDVTCMDPRYVAFDAPMVHALGVLADAAVFHHLRDAFIRATQTIYEIACNGGGNGGDELHKAEQLSYNIMNVFGMLVNKTVRAMRLQPMVEEYRNLRVFSDENAASTLVQIVRAGIELFRGTDGTHVGQLHMALGVAIDALKYAAQDAERRVASVTGQPAPLDTSGFERSIEPCLRELMAVLMDVVTSERHGQTRLKIVQFFVEVQRVCSDDIVGILDSLRFGLVALKMVVVHGRNSLLHHVIMQAVEWALISEAGGGRFAQHWLQESKLVETIVRVWVLEEGSTRWNSPAEVARTPFLSAIVHMACCVEHWVAMRREEGVDPCQFVEAGVLKKFEAFCEGALHKLLEEEKKSLCGPKPKRRSGRGAGVGIGRSFGGLGTTSAAMLRRGSSGVLGGRAHLVRSASAHRFGFVQAGRESRSRLDDMFAERDEGRSVDAFVGFGGRGATSFASIFDVESDATL